MIEEPGHPPVRFLSRWELPLIAVLSPLFVFPPLERPLIWIALLLPALWLAAAARGAELLPRTRLNGSLFLLLLAAAVSLAASFDLLFAAPKALGLVLGVAVFFALVRRISDARSLAVAVDLFALFGAVLALAGLLGTNWIAKVPLLATLTERLPAVIRGVPGASDGFQPNAVAGGLILFLPVQLAAVAAGGRRWRVARVAVLLFSLAVLLLTQSRNGWLSLFVAVAAWAVWQPRGVRRWRAAAVVGLVVVSAGGVILSERGAAEQHLGEGVRGDISGRAELWSRAIEIMRDFPLTGVGMNGYRRVVPVVYPLRLIRPDFDVAHAHNHLLHTGAELGLPGLVAYLAVWMGLAALLFTAIRAARRRRTRWVAGGLGAGFLAYFLFGISDTIALGAKVGIFFWIAMALAVCIHREAVTEPA